MTLIYDPLFDTGEMSVLDAEYVVDERQDEVDRLREFVDMVTEVRESYAVVCLDNPLPVSNIKLNELARRVTATTYEVCHVTIHERRKFVFECRDVSLDCEQAASIWLRKFFDLLASIGETERGDLLAVHDDARRIRDALINPSRPSGWGSIEL